MIWTVLIGLTLFSGGLALGYWLSRARFSGQAEELERKEQAVRQSRIQIQRQRYQDSTSRIHRSPDDERDEQTFLREELEEKYLELAVLKEDARLEKQMFEEEKQMLDNEKTLLRDRVELLEGEPASFVDVVEAEETPVESDQKPSHFSLSISEPGTNYPFVTGPLKEKNQPTEISEQSESEDPPQIEEPSESEEPIAQDDSGPEEAPATRDTEVSSDSNSSSSPENAGNPEDSGTPDEAGKLDNLDNPEKQYQPPEVIDIVEKDEEVQFISKRSIDDSVSAPEVEGPEFNFHWQASRERKPRSRRFKKSELNLASLGSDHRSSSQGDVASPPRRTIESERESDSSTISLSLSEQESQFPTFRSLDQIIAELVSGKPTPEQATSEPPILERSPENEHGDLIREIVKLSPEGYDLLADLGYASLIKLANLTSSEVRRISDLFAVSASDIEQSWVPTARAHLNLMNQ